MTLRRILLEHPEAVGETYLEHQRAAAGFGLQMIAAGAGCLVHAIFPAAFTSAAGRTVERLHRQMASRGVSPQSAESAESPGANAKTAAIRTRS